ncbi:MAG: hypothetical protein ABI912_12855 [Actinomycetota bacterium]
MTVEKPAPSPALVQALAGRRDWQRGAALLWAAAGLVGVTLIAATFAFGDLVERAHLAGWTRTKGEIVAGTGGDPAIRYVVAGDERERVLDPTINPDHKEGERPETWFDPTHPDHFVLAPDTPLHDFPVAGGIGLASLLAGLTLLRLAARSRRTARMAYPPAAQPAAAAYPAREWLLAACVPFLVSVSALGWVVAHPEIEGSDQLSLALLCYLLAMYGVGRWLRGELTAMLRDQRGSSAA